MKAVVKLMLLASFFVVAFVPVGTEYEWVVWALILGMLLLVGVYYWMLYGVSQREIETICSEGDVKFSRFGGRIDGIGSNEQLIRGKLVVCSDQLMFVKRQDRDVIIDWKEDIQNIQSVHVQSRMLKFRSGYVFEFSDGSQQRITTFKAQEHEQHLLKALGW